MHGSEWNRRWSPMNVPESTWYAAFCINGVISWKTSHLMAWTTGVQWLRGTNCSSITCTTDNPYRQRISLAMSAANFPSEEFPGTRFSSDTSVHNWCGTVKRCIGVRSSRSPKWNCEISPVAVKEHHRFQQTSQKLWQLQHLWCNSRLLNQVGKYFKKDMAVCRAYFKQCMLWHNCIHFLFRGTWNNSCLVANKVTRRRYACTCVKNLKNL